MREHTGIGRHYRGMTIVEAFITIVAVVASVAWLVEHKDLEDQVKDGIVYLPTNYDGPNECPAGYTKGDFVMGGTHYTCEKKPD